jgi:hypothetical protein
LINEKLAIIAITLALTLAVGMVAIGTAVDGHHIAYAKNHKPNPNINKQKQKISGDAS